MAKPPAGSSLLFGALADSGRIKQRKNGNYRMVLKGVDEIDWFTDRPDRVEGIWKPQKLLRKWDKYFASSEPNVQATVEADEEQAMATFEMFKPIMKSGKMIFNIKPLTDSGRDKLTGLQDIELSNISLFIDNAKTQTFNVQLPWMKDLLPLRTMSYFKQDVGFLDLSYDGVEFVFSDNLHDDLLPSAPPWVKEFITGIKRSAGKDHVDLSYKNLTKASLSNGEDINDNLNEPRTNLVKADLTKAILNSSDLIGADLTGADLAGADLTNANFYQATMMDTTLTDAIWKDTFCPNGDLVNSPCTAKQLIPA